MVAKFGVFLLTNSAAVLTDALESIVNVVAAAFLVLTMWIAHKPADRDHPYGHGKIEFIAVGVEGGLIFAAGLFIVYESVRRLIVHEVPENLDVGALLLVIIGLGNLALALLLFRIGRRYDSAAMVADARHLMTDVVTTVAVTAGLLLTHITQRAWLDPIFALLLVAFIFYTSGRLLMESVSGLMDRIDLEDDRLIRAILDDEVRAGRIADYHKVRHRHQGSFHWVEMHLQMQGDLSVRQGHEIAGRIERRIEEALGHGNATAHIEPMRKQDTDEGGLGHGDAETANDAQGSQAVKHQGRGGEGG